MKRFALLGVLIIDLIRPLGGKALAQLAEIVAADVNVAKLHAVVGGPELYAVPGV